MHNLLEGRVAIVTGAGRGIGRAVAQHLASVGARIVINDYGCDVHGFGSSSEPAQQTVTKIRRAGGQAVAVDGSVADMATGERLVKAAFDTFGQLDIVVTAAGILRDRMIFNMTDEEWDDVISVNLKGTFSVVKPASIYFREQRSGCIITFSSESGLIGVPGQANYGAAKSGIGGFTKVIARDLGKYGVTANSIVPRAHTRMVDTIPANALARLKESGFDAISNGRVANPEDVGPLVSYLSSDYGAHVNGQFWFVYGGHVGLLSQPRRLKTIYNSNPPGRWQLSKLDHLVPTQLLNLSIVGDCEESMPPRRLDSKVAIVTGAGRGIGRGIARLLASEGASVVVNDVGSEIDGTGADRSFADQVVEEIAESGGRAVSSYESVTSRGAGESIVNKAIESFGRLDIVVTAAGILRDRMIFNMSEQEWDDVIAVHLKGTFSVVRSAASIFREQQSGRIVTFSSVSGLVGQSGQSNYGAAKDGIAGFTRVVAKEMSRYGVTVNSISPGAATRMTQSVPDTTRQLQQKKLRGLSSSAPPVGVLSNEPEDVAPMVVWLASDAADRVTGRIFYCSGNIVSEVGHPVPVRTIYKDGRWTPEELAGAISTTTGIDLVNPAPRQSPS